MIGIEAVASDQAEDFHGNDRRRMVRTQNGAGYRAAVTARLNGPNEAAQRGAIAFLLRSVWTESHRMPHTGDTLYVDGRVPLPAFALSRCFAN